MLNAQGREYDDGIDLTQLFKVKENVADRPVIRKYLLPAEAYNHDHGDILYVIMSPIELPYRAMNIMMHGYCHLVGRTHDHAHG